MDPANFLVHVLIHVDFCYETLAGVPQYHIDRPNSGYDLRQVSSCIYQMEANYTGFPSQKKWSSNFTLQLKSFSSVASGIWNALPNHLSSVPTLPVFRRALKHHLFLLAYPDSSAKSGMIKPAQCISLRDTVPTTAIAQPVNTMPPI